MKNTRMIAQAGVIAAVYAVLTFIMVQSPLGWGPVQVRLSEALTVVACLTPAGIAGLTLGSVIANASMLAQTGVLGMLDVVFGSLGTFLGAAWAWRHRAHPGMALLGPVVANALIVPAYLPILVGGATGLDFYRLDIPGLATIGLPPGSGWLAMYLFGVCTVCIGQAIVVYGLGLPLLGVLKRLGVGSPITRGDSGDV